MLRGVLRQAADVRDRMTLSFHAPIEVEPGRFVCTAHRRSAWPEWPCPSYRRAMEKQRASEQGTA